MAILSEADLSPLRIEAASLACDLACVIKRPPESDPNDWGGPPSGSETTVATTVVGLVEPSASQLQNYGYKIGSLATWQAHFPYGTDIKEQDVIEVEGNRLTVQVVLQPRSYEVLTSALVSKTG
jgi:hypothetical protein